MSDAVVGCGEDGQDVQGRDDVVSMCGGVVLRYLL